MCGGETADFVIDESGRLRGVHDIEVFEPRGFAFERHDPDGTGRRKVGAKCGEAGKFVGTVGGIENEIESAGSGRGGQFIAGGGAQSDSGVSRENRIGNSENRDTGFGLEAEFIDETFRGPNLARPFFGEGGITQTVGGSGTTVMSVTSLMASPRCPG